MKIRIGLDYTVLAYCVIAADLPDGVCSTRAPATTRTRSAAYRWRKRGVPVFIYDVTNRTALPGFDESIRALRASMMASVVENTKRRASRVARALSIRWRRRHSAQRRRADVHLRLGARSSAT
jgi:hypothetical protein